MGFVSRQQGAGSAWRRFPMIASAAPRPRVRRPAPVAAPDGAPVRRAGGAGKASGRGRASCGLRRPVNYDRSEGLARSRKRRPAPPPAQTIALGIFSVYYVGEKVIMAAKPSSSSDH